LTDPNPRTPERASPVAGTSNTVPLSPDLIETIGSLVLSPSPASVRTTQQRQGSQAGHSSEAGAGERASDVIGRPSERMIWSVLQRQWRRSCWWDISRLEAKAAGRQLGCTG
jgi:hypothetical protein